MSESPIESFWPIYRRRARSVVMVDLVESVRLFELDEEDAIRRWQAFSAAVDGELLPRHRGRLVRTAGDGLILEFDDALNAVRCALAMQPMIEHANSQRPRERWMLLRTGVHVADLLADAHDVYGAGVNLTARLMSQAGPGEIVVSAEVRDQLVAGLDAEILDLGELILKNVNQPVRAYRVGKAADRSPLWSGTMAGATDKVSVAVIPFAPRAANRDDDLIGDTIADDLITALSRLSQLHVISRLSTTAFRRREASLSDIATALGVSHVVYGSYLNHGSRIDVHAQLADARSNQVLCSVDVSGSADEVFLGQSPMVGEIVEKLCSALVNAEVRRACSLPLPTLESYTILLGAVALMHRLSLGDFERARTMLQYLIERHPRATAPRAWLGKWHVLRVAQGWSATPTADAVEARALVGAALDLEPTHALALAIDGLICAFIRQDLDTAGERYDAALQANPNESLAWLFRSAWHAYRGRGGEAVEHAIKARDLSPLDPMKYYYDNFVSHAMLSAGDYAGAITYGQRSMEANRTHRPTLRMLAIAQALAGSLDEARSTIRELLHVEPDATVQRFLQRYPGRGTELALRYAAALREAGLPEG